MKGKTVKAALRRKVDAWLASIESPAVRELVAKNTIVTGGCIASMLLKEKVNDYDVYFRDRATAYAVASYYLARFKPQAKQGISCEIVLTDAAGAEAVAYGTGRIKIMVKSAGIASSEGTERPYEYFETNHRSEDAGEYVSAVMQDPGDIAEAQEELEVAAHEVDNKPPYRPVFISTNAITLSGGVQIVIRFFGEPDEIHESYDFAHCTSYWTSRDGDLVLRPAALEALLARELRYIGSKYPVCSLFRLRKFLGRGWTINAGQVLKMCLQVSALDLTDVRVLEDQLTGVDVAYFVELVAKLKEKDPLKVNSAYLIEIIDRMF